MKRVHVHLSVPNLEQAVGFYSALFGSPPSLQRSDYAKWLLDDPKLNFALSQLGHGAGLDHLGLQTESRKELRAMTYALKRANVTV
ncbi:hypothetical protein FBY03_11039 [Pseudomonas sp. SJZ079]|uniref:VOC family protein n=1 Tax=Pseudomonas sp. SJZ079 TaxID=2572887 RepID=UPI00119B85FB|nr:VOC family protein [Pseudomonas sp. SJZ079]TWC35620.1 hypothetical protein FBY03_11039 [Pseudomonas sp. SJZ079]